MNRLLTAVVVVTTSTAFLATSIPTEAEAQNRRGAGMKATSKAKRPASRPAARPATRPSSPRVANRSRPNVNYNRPDRNRPGGNYSHNVNVDRNVNIRRDVDIDIDRRGGWYDDRWHPVATAAAVTATAMVVGSIVRSIPPDCRNTVVNGYAYYQCGNTWYKPQYAGTDVTYIVVNSPR